MGAFKSFRRRKWKAAVNGEFRKRHGVDLRTVGELVGRTTLHDLLNDEYELVPQNPVVAAENFAQMLDRVYRLDVTSLAPRDSALQVPNWLRRGGRSRDRRSLTHAGATR